MDTSDLHKIHEEAAAANSGLKLMRLHTDTLFVHDGAGHLLYVNIPLSPEHYAAPMLYVGQTREGTVIRFCHDMSENIRDRAREGIESLITPRLWQL